MEKLTAYRTSIQNLFQQLAQYHGVVRYTIEVGENGLY